MSSPNPAGPPARGDWPAQLTSRLESVTAIVEDKAVRPLVWLSRLLVYGILAAGLGLVVAVLGTIAVVRLLNTYLLPDWGSLAVVGGIMTLSGMLFWSRRKKGSVS